MHTWALVWWLTATVSTACPDYKADPYTGELSQTPCLVNHCVATNVVRSETFATRADAEKFKSQAPAALRKRMVLIHMSEESE